MTVLTVIQDACTSGIALAKPTSVFGSSVREHLELASLVQEVADMIVSAHEWQKLKKIATITGDGSTEDFDFPSDYDRMLEEADLWSSALETPLSKIPDSNQWLGLDVQSFDFVINAWTIYDEQIHIKPALASAETAKYWYISNLVVLDSGATRVASFTDDADTFRLSERLLKLGLIYKWRENKGLPYAENMADFEIEKAKLITRDKGSRVIRIGQARVPDDVTVAYPKSITG